jgi:Arc/MetJ-type ribon-helix-helix transcriptional regulator
VQQKKIYFTERQLRFIRASLGAGRAADRSEIVRQALNDWIEEQKRKGLLTEEDGGEPETVKDD